MGGGPTPGANSLMPPNLDMSSFFPELTGILLDRDGVVPANSCLERLLTDDDVVEMAEEEESLLAAAAAALSWKISAMLFLGAGDVSDILPERIGGGNGEQQGVRGRETETIMRSRANL